MLNRRDWLKSITISAGCSVLAPRLGAELRCADNAFGVRTCQAGIDPDKMDTAYAVQQQSEWCWAACIQMVFAYYDHPVSQGNIVRKTWGTVTNMPGQPSQIINDLNRDWTDEDGDDFSVEGDVFSANAITAAQDLANDYPLILGSLGHAMVLTAITYQGVPNRYGAGNVIAATVRDPLPGRGKRLLSPQEYVQTFLLARIRIT